jgi:hypothetical protein
MSYTHPRIREHTDVYIQLLMTLGHIDEFTVTPIYMPAGRDAWGQITWIKYEKGISTRMQFTLHTDGTWEVTESRRPLVQLGRPTHETAVYNSSTANLSRAARFLRRHFSVRKN